MNHLLSSFPLRTIVVSTVMSITGCGGTFNGVTAGTVVEYHPYGEPFSKKAIAISEILNTCAQGSVVNPSACMREIRVGIDHDYGLPEACENVYSLTDARLLVLPACEQKATLVNSGQMWRDQNVDLVVKLKLSCHLMLIGIAEPRLPKSLVVVKPTDAVPAVVGCSDALRERVSVDATFTTRLDKKVWKSP